MSGVMPIEKGPHILSVVLHLTIPPMRSNCADPVGLRVRGASESSVSLLTELGLKSWNSILLMLGAFDFDDKDRAKGEWGCRHLHDLDGFQDCQEGDVVE